MKNRTKFLISFCLITVFLILSVFSCFAVEYSGYFVLRDSPASYALFPNYSNGTYLEYNANLVVSAEGETFNVDSIRFDMQDINTDQQGVTISFHITDTEDSLVWFSVFENADGTTQIGNRLVDYELVNGFIDIPSGVSEFLFNYVSFTAYDGGDNPDDPSFEGNPFTNIMEMIIEALDVNLFGSFSLWDMLTTICGLFAVIWLLKLLAGG